MMTQPVSIVGATMTAYGAVLRRSGAVLARTLVPASLGFAVICVVLRLFLDQLGSFLRAPTPRTATLALGVLAAGFFVALFLHAIATLAVVEIAGNGSARFRPFFRVDRGEWRLYAAYLRLMLVAGLFVAGIAGAIWLGRGLHLASPYVLVVGGYAAGAAGLIALTVRLGFLLAPIALAERGPVLRRAFALSSGSSGGILVIMIAALVPALIVLFAGQYAVSALGWVPYVHVRLGTPPRDLVSLLRQELPPFRAAFPAFLAILLPSYYAATVMLSAAAAIVYRRRVSKASGGSSRE